MFLESLVKFMYKFIWIWHYIKAAEEIILLHIYFPNDYWVFRFLIFKG